MACDKSNQFFQCPVCSEELAHTIPYLNEAFQHVAEFQNLEIAICSHCGLGSQVQKDHGICLRSFTEACTESLGVLVEVVLYRSMIVRR